MKLDRTVSPRRSLALAFAIAILPLGGCMTSTPTWDDHFGEALKSVTQAQIIDPQAGERNPSTPGIDGRAAVSTMDRYGKSFDSPAPTVNQFVITGSGGGGQ